MSQKLTKRQQQLVREFEKDARISARVHQNWQSFDRASREDMEAEALLELCETARRWKKELGPFRPYLLQRLKWRFQEVDKRHKFPAHVPEKAQALIMKMRRAINAGAETPSEVAAVTGIRIDKVREIWPYRESARASQEHQEYIPDPSDTEETVQRSLARDAVQGAVKQLPAVQRSVIEARFGFTTGAPCTTDEIAKTLNLDLDVVVEAETAAVLALQQLLEGVEAP